MTAQDAMDRAVRANVRVTVSDRFTLSVNVPAILAALDAAGFVVVEKERLAELVATELSHEWCGFDERE